MARYLIFIILSKFSFALDDYFIYSSLVDTNYDHGIFDQQIHAVYKITIENSNAEYLIPPFSSIQDIYDQEKILFTANENLINFYNDGSFPANDSIMVYESGVIDTLSITGRDPRFTNVGDIIFRKIISENNYNELYDLYKFSYSDSSVTLIVDSAYRSSKFTYKLSPDNQKIVYLKDSGFDSQDINIIDINSGVETFIMTIGDEQISEIWLSDIYWSNDSYLYFSVRDSTDLYQLFKINSSGIDDELMQLTSFENGLRMLATNDSHLDKIILVSDSCTYDSTMENCIFAYDFQANQTSYIGYTGGCLPPVIHAWSSDNSKIALGTGWNCFFPGPGLIRTFDLVTGENSWLEFGRFHWEMNLFWVDNTNELDNSNITNIPSKLQLHQNYPNPFNPTTHINYDLPEDSFVSIVIYDVTGRNIRNLMNVNQTAGYHSIRWDAKNDIGEGVAAGMYIYTIQAGEFRATKKMVLLK